jgi:hypothetical protein|uniref:Uncharacterized protein n=1 Tax=viral metagenome TaxID=1070528 RepID=A0A6C0LQ14_9ZZZZ
MESTPLKLADGNILPNTYYEFPQKKRSKFSAKFGAWIKKVVKFFTTPPN